MKLGVELNKKLYTKLERASAISHVSINELILNCIEYALPDLWAVSNLKRPEKIFHPMLEKLRKRHGVVWTVTQRSSMLRSEYAIANPRIGHSTTYNIQSSTGYVVFSGTKEKVEEYLEKRMRSRD